MKVLGGYRAAGETGYGVGAALRFIVYHFGDLVLISGVIPFCALVVLTFLAAKHGEENTRVRAFLATTVSLTCWVTIEVGIFASRNVGHAAERNLFPLIPLLLLALVLWLQRGAPRPLLASVVAAGLALVLLVAFPFEAFTTVAATPSAFTQIPLLELTTHVNLDLAVPLAAAVLLVACALLPRRILAVGIPVLLLVLGAAASVSASRFIVTQANLVQYLTIGPDKSWVDDNANGSVTFLYAGQANWEIPWQARFWNSRLDGVGRFLGMSIPGGLPSPSVGPSADGTLVNDRTGQPLSADYLAASTYFAMVGTEISRPRPDIVLWRVEQPPRMQAVAAGRRVRRARPEREGAAVRLRVQRRNDAGEALRRHGARREGDAKQHAIPVLRGQARRVTPARDPGRDSTIGQRCVHHPIHVRRAVFPPRDRLHLDPALVLEEPDKAEQSSQP